jgi:hypothetical protein
MRVTRMRIETSFRPNRLSIVGLSFLLLALLVICRSSRIAGATFGVVCAKSQNVMTVRTMPETSLWLRIGRCVGAPGRSLNCAGDWKPPAVYDPHDPKKEA